MIDLLLARVAFRDAVRPKRLVTAAILIALPALVALLMKSLTPAASWDPGKIYDNITTLMIFGFTLTILAVVNGTGVVGQEMEQRTIVYLTTRPLPRWRILLAKSLVSFVAVGIVAVVAQLVLALAVFGVKEFGDAGLAPDIRALLIGSVAYGALFVLLGTLTPRPLLYGLLYVFGWENLAPVMPGSFAKLSIMTYLHILAARQNTDPDASAATVNKPADILLRFTQPQELDISNKQAWITLIVVSLVALVMAMIFFTRREYTPREDQD